MAITKRSYQAHSITLPDLPTNPYNFFFTVNLPDGTYQFNFYYILQDPNGGNNVGWYLYVTLPDGVTIRNARVSPNAVNWSRSPDVGLVFISSLQDVGQNDLANTQMYMLYWQ